ncbi:MAG: hypothetical protein COA82_01385 [Alkaliphilus sp.]|nr:hypothetical protein [Alkaliphilus sp. AH-315-G20]MBN4069491.1 hypothetical protein [bacterium AH-315-G05]PHS36262.1 MAG: hypothetical protein COA82_01385 [Alkaliphilus sp.]
MEEKIHYFFSDLFGKLTIFTNKIEDEGILIQMELDINEEIGKFGRFRDVPTKREIQKYLPIVFESDTYLYSDIVFLTNTVREYLKKELFNKREIPNNLESLNKILSEKEKFMEIIVINLVESSRKK